MCRGNLILAYTREVLDPSFHDDTLDVVVRQNVIECVNEREDLVAQCLHILKPGGRLLLGHHDFDGMKPLDFSSHDIAPYSASRAIPTLVKKTAHSTVEEPRLSF